MAQIDFEQELHNHFGQVKDFTIGVNIAMHFYEMGRNAQRNGVWNDAKQNPKLNKDFLACLANGESIIMSTSEKLNNTPFVLAIKQWAYLDDILPTDKKE